MDTISPVYARLVLRELERRGKDPAPLFAGIPTSRDELLRGGDISVEDFLHILRTGDGLLDDEQLGFLLGRSVHVFAMGPVGIAMASAPNLRGGLQVLESFTRLHATYIDIRARSTLQGMSVTILYRHDTGYTERFHTETAMMLLQQYMETLTGNPVEDAQYRLAIPEPENMQDYASTLKGRIRFNARANEVVIPYRWLDAPSPFYHEGLWRQAQVNLSTSLRQQSESEGNPFTLHVAGLLRSSEPPLPGLGDVANGLNVSQRTLNRRLQAEGSSFRRLKSDAMADWAKQYLRETEYSVEVIAEELGYKDTANFRRAFRRSEGCSPVEYRQESANRIL